jgi:4a-hydroxytetrahydrobiopterin dehydratase
MLAKTASPTKLVTKPKATIKMSDLIPTEELEALLKKAPEWEVEGEAITRSIEFEEFSEAIDFVNDLAEIAEEAQHYPDICILDNRVTLALTSHDVGGITELDVELAQRIDNLVD